MASAFRTGAVPADKVWTEAPKKRRNSKNSTEASEKAPAEATDVGSLISGEIIPRLLLIEPTRCATGQNADRTSISRDEADQFATLPLTLEADELLGKVETFIDRGVSVESVFVDLLAPSARKLGEMWEEDTCDFIDVTMGLWRLQEVLRSVAYKSPALINDALAPRSILIGSMPGDQHSFGALMLEECFARAGWDSEVLIEPGRREMLTVITQRGFDIVGLTLSSDCPSDVLSDFINGLRSVSRNPRLMVSDRRPNGQCRSGYCNAGRGRRYCRRCPIRITSCRTACGRSEALGCGN